MTHSLDELKAICEKANPNWHRTFNNKIRTNYGESEGRLYSIKHDGDARFMEVSRTAVPELIAEVERLRAAMTGVLSGLDHKSDESFRVSIKAGYPDWNLAVHAKDMLKARAALEKKP